MPPNVFRLVPIDTCSSSSSSQVLLVQIRRGAQERVSEYFTKVIMLVECHCIANKQAHFGYMTLLQERMREAGREAKRF